MRSNPLLRLVLPVLLIALVWFNKTPTAKNSSYHEGSSLENVGTSSEKSANGPQDFQAWLDDYRESPDPAAIPTGIEFAKSRRAALKRLITTDPELALRFAISEKSRAGLPQAITEHLEIPISAAGGFERVVSCYLGELKLPDHQAEEERFATIGERRYRAFTYGSRAELGTKDRISMIGIAIDDVLALSPDPVRRMASPNSLSVEAFGEEKHFADEGDLDRYINILLANEAASGPGESNSGSPWTEGNKRILYLRVRFANQAPSYEPVSLAQAQSNQQDVSDHLRIASYGKLLFTTEITDVITLPGNMSDYVGQALGSMMDDALAIADTLGNAQGKDWDYNNYDLYTIISDFGIGSYAGIAQVGGRRSHLQRGYTSLRTAGHEFGHNLGLSHAYYRYSSDLNPRGPTPTNGLSQVEYGHRFSLMSAQFGTDFDNPALPHFTVHEKWRLDWLTDSDLADITSGLQSGTYRLYQNDHEGARNLRALRLPSGGALPNYWLSYRTAWRTPARSSDNPYLLNGLVFDWTPGGGGTSTLLDMTPYSNDGPSNSAFYLNDNNDKWDAALLIGHTYTDPESRVSVTPVARGGQAPDEYIDVFVHLDLGSEVELISEVDQCRAVIPEIDTANGTEWTAISYDDQGWNYSGSLGVGYDFSPTFLPYFNIDVGADMVFQNESCYIRIPFTLTETNFESLRLRMRYDDGFVAYLNGIKIAEANAPASPVWNSGATNFTNDSDAVQFVEFSADPAIGALVPGLNILAIHGLNRGTNNADFLIQPSLVATLPTSQNSPPSVSLSADTLEVAVNEDVTFTASATDPDGDILAYAWDFDIANTFAPEGLNNATAVRRWSSPGLYAVTITCSDRKGGISRDRLLVRVGNPGNEGVISGQVLQGGTPVAGARVFVNGTNRQSMTLPDGSYLIAGLSTSSGTTLGAMMDGEVFQASVTMPVTPDPTLEGVNFLGHSSALSTLPAQTLTISPHRSTVATSTTVTLSAQTWDNTLAEDVLIPLGDTWRYLDTGIDPGGSWQTGSFDDSSWLSGPAELGYGDSQNTTVSYGPDVNNRHLTTWFRRSFSVPDPTTISRLKLAVKRDDGIRVFLNGTEIARDNLPAGGITSGTKATNDVSTTDEEILLSYAVDPALLIAGENVIAAEVHQATDNNSDLSFDLELSATRNLSAAVPSWSVSPATATISPDGTFLSHFAGTFTVTATSGSLTAEAVVIVTPTGTGYLEWIARFPLDDLSPFGDPDGDCLSNLAEFAMGSDPSRQSSMARPRLTPDSLYRYRRLRERNPGDATGTPGDGYSLDGINYTLETSTDLDLWQRASEVLTVTAEGLPIDQGDGYELVTLRLDPPAALETQRVYRLKVMQE